MMTQVDELNQSKHMNMTITEFYEAICRVADKIPNENLPDYYPMHKSVSPFNLDKKIESLLTMIFRNQAPPKIVNKLEMLY